MESQIQLKQLSTSFCPDLISEGDGAKVRRYIGTHQNPSLDPFLMLDLGCSKLPVGFPDHPHRGFETVSYLLKGSFCHEDFTGRKGELHPGDVQWMTAGRGIVHSEMPMSFDEEASGFQLWVNLNKANKMCAPRYQEIKSAEIPVYKDDTMSAKVIAGEVFGVKGPIEAVTPTYYIDFNMQKNAEYEHVIPRDWNCMVIVHKGALIVQGNGKELTYGHCSVFKLNELQEEKVNIKSLRDDTGFILLAGKPLREPIAWKGPFVMNTKAEIDQAFKDYFEGVNGFEGSRTWKSQNRNLKYGRSSSV
ncbi:hypothetical protein FGO68_gene4493 [Halteria grandinella]|uniref:Pirin n=1 Tax=Halteria grandinella TaxID=5974 RepID=A0A8J8NL75_HALGN|nr:hypothetical protein FGO68_gene4493 [Halteria grandinella]